jgi:hypothetical protein
MGYGKIELGMTQKGDMSHKRIFKKPEELWNAFREYVDWLKQEANDGAWQKTHFVGKDGEERKERMELPLTQAGFYAYYYKKYGKNIVQYFANQNGLFDEFKDVVFMIRQEVRDKQITGGLLGHYNANITARLNNLHDNQNVNHGGIESIEIKVVN